MFTNRTLVVCLLVLGGAFMANVPRLESKSEPAAPVTQIGSFVPASHAPAGVTIAEMEQHYGNQARPVVDLAPTFRQRNRGGSCVHATTVMLLRWQGLYEMADWWWNTYHGGESSRPHERKMQQAGLKYVMTDDGDTSLLEWGLATRRGCGVTWGGAHCVMLAGRTPDGQAVILDNNAIDRFKYQPWDQFLSEWRRCGSWAFVIVSGNTPPPVPTR